MTKPVQKSPESEQDAYRRIETIREDAEREDRLARNCTDPTGKVEHEARAATFWRRYERALSAQPEPSVTEGVGEIRERIARIIDAQLALQDIGEELVREPGWDLTTSYLDQGIVDFGLIADAILAALPPPARGGGEDEVNRLIADADRLARRMGARLIPDPGKVEAFRRGALASPKPVGEAEPVAWNGLGSPPSSLARVEISADDPIYQAFKPSRDTIDRIEKNERANAQALAAIRDMMVGHVTNWPEPKRFGTALSLIDKTIRALEARAIAAERERDLLDRFGKRTNLELSYGSTDDPSEAFWMVHSVNGGVNDREWTLIGQGDTPAEAIRQALGGGAG